MYSKKYRLSNKKDFDRVWQSRQSAYLKLLGVKITGNNEENNRFGVIVSTKISKKAVIRNKIKRRIRAVIKKELEKLKIGYDIVIFSQKAIVDSSYKEIETELTQIFNKLKLYQ
ncbi:MAG: ribonuclease P protein component [Patescibacteria group bacterium]|nr:ribonuclease P protein component [Patescibacteria group bacterium]